MSNHARPKIIVRPRDLKPSSHRMRLRGVFNPAAERLPNGKIVLYCRVGETPYHGERYFLSPRMIGTNSFVMKMEKIPRVRVHRGDYEFKTKDGLTRLPTISHLRRIVLDENGETVLNISQKPDFFGIKNDGEFGVEDARLVYLKELRSYAMSYVTVGDKSGVSSALAVSKDLEHWKRLGIVFCQQNKDVVLFPEKVNGYFMALHRPEGTMNFNQPSIWISYSKDLEYWGRDKPLVGPRNHSWDAIRIGAGIPPIRIPEGFLEIYHGVANMHGDPEAGKIYCAGALLLDAKNPEKILARSSKTVPLFRPELEEEKVGFVNNVAFPSDAVLSKDQKEVLVFSGAGDSCVSVRHLKVNSILNNMTWFK